MNAFFATLSPTALILIKIVLTFGLTVVLTLVAVLGVLIIQKSLRLRLHQEHALKIENRSNFPAQYSLEVFSGLETLLCEFLFNGNKLPALTITEEIETEQSTTQPSPVGSTKVSAPASKKDFKAGVAKVGVIATILSTIGGLLPGSVGKALKAQGDQARAAQANARQAIDAPEEMKNRVSSLSEQSGKLTGQPKPAGVAATPKGAATAQAATSGETATSSGLVTTRLIEIKNSAVTEVLMPGQKLHLVLRFSTLHTGPITQPLPYSLNLRALPQVLIGEAPLKREILGAVGFEAVPAFRRYLAPAASLLLGLFCLTCFAYFVLQIW